MPISVIDLLRTAANDTAPVTCHDGIYAIKRDDGVVVAWDRDDAQQIIAGIQEPETVVDVDLSVHGQEASARMPRVASCEGLRLSLSGRPVLFRLAQWGGQGGMLPSTGFGGGMAGPMSGVDQFGTHIVRQQFDISLEQARPSREKNDWDRSLETRLQHNDLYGHKRNERDHNLEPYTKTFQERRKLKRRRFLQRMKQNRDMGDQKVKENSVEFLKATPVDPRHVVPLEFRLKDKRQQPDPEPGEKRPYHGPESMFRVFPKPGVRTAFTKQHGVGSTPFAPWRDYEDAINSIMDPEAPKPSGPVSASRSDAGGVEHGLAGLKGENSPWPSISPHLSQDGDQPSEVPYVGGKERMHSMPAGATEQVADQSGGLDNYLNQNEKKLYFNQWNTPLVADQYAESREPEQGKAFLPPDVLENIAESFRDKLEPLTRQQKPQVNPQQSLESQLPHRGWPWRGRTPTIDEYNTPPFPYATTPAEGRNYWSGR